MSLAPRLVKVMQADHQVIRAVDAANDVVVSMAIYRKLIGLAGERGAHVDRDAICNPPAPPPPSSTSKAAYRASRKSWSKK